MSVKMNQTQQINDTEMDTNLLTYLMIDAIMRVHTETDLVMNGKMMDTMTGKVISESGMITLDKIIIMKMGTIIEILMVIMGMVSLTGNRIETHRDAGSTLEKIIINHTVTSEEKIMGTTHKMVTQDQV